MENNKHENFDKPLRFRATSWVLYDLANTIFAASVTFLFVPNVGAASVGLINTLAMIVAGFATPIFASLADRTGRAGAYNVFATLICVVAMACFGVISSVPILMVIFFIGIVFYQAALVFYNAMLPSVVREERIGLVSGLGVGLGYIGTVVTLVFAVPLKTKYGLQPAFLMTAIAFLIFALPCLLLVRDRRKIKAQKVTWPLISLQWRELLGTIKELPSKPVLMWFLIANFWAVDVLNTSILFFGRFLKDSFSQMAADGELVLFGNVIKDIDEFLIIGGLGINVPALFFALLLGWFADKFGSRKMFFVAIASLATGLSGAGIFEGVSPLLFLIAICMFGGVGLAGIWTVGRKLLIELVPKELIGRYFGLYGITNKVSVIGSTVFGFTLAYISPRWAILSQVLPLLFAFFCMAKMAKHQQSDSDCD